jgi:hypothetical protein
MGLTYDQLLHVLGTSGNDGTIAGMIGTQGCILNTSLHHASRAAADESQQNSDRCAKKLEDALNAAETRDDTQSQVPLQSAMLDKLRCMQETLAGDSQCSQRVQEVDEALRRQMSSAVGDPNAVQAAAKAAAGVEERPTGPEAQGDAAMSTELPQAPSRPPVPTAPATGNAAPQNVPPQHTGEASTPTGAVAAPPTVPLQQTGQASAPAAGNAAPQNVPLQQGGQASAPAAGNLAPQTAAPQPVPAGQEPPLPPAGMLSPLPAGAGDPNNYSVNDKGKVLALGKLKSTSNKWSKNKWDSFCAKTRTGAFPVELSGELETDKPNLFNLYIENKENFPAVVGLITSKRIEKEQMAQNKSKTFKERDLLAKYSEEKVKLLVAYCKKQKLVRPDPYFPKDESENYYMIFAGSEIANISRIVDTTEVPQLSNSYR